MASAVRASPHSLSSRQASGAQNVVYWGQNSENGNLAAYCTPTSGIDVLVLSFLYEFGNGINIPSGVIGPTCFISTTGQPQLCDDLASEIAQCQSAGVKIILSLGGASGSYSLQSRAEAESIGQYLWESYGNSGNTTVPRPFGNVAVDGFDFDIEVNLGSSQYYQYMVSTLRSNFASDPSKKYYITGAPQCPIPEPNMGIIIGNATFDYIWVQFYNNNNGLDNIPFESCALGINGGAPFNYDEWVSFIAGTPSANAKIFVGVPASPLAANGNSGGAVYYATPSQLASVISEVKDDSHFGGIMMWAAGYSDSNVNNGCTYAQEAKQILLTGAPCGGSAPPPPSSTATRTTARPTSTTTRSTTTTRATSTTTSAPPSSTCPVAGGRVYCGLMSCVLSYTYVSISVYICIYQNRRI
ncbi:glycoside hydrolase family 18 protein [Xylogone sp. PMI_703]|nr:glycoside hydrolase family 18 protein [Xylogone sp. PMI_703]